MSDPNAVLVPVRCDCGNHYKVPVGGLGLEALEFFCPECDMRDRFSSLQIANIVEQHTAVMETAVEMLRRIPLK